MQQKTDTTDLRRYEAFAEALVHVLLTGPATGDQIDPQVIEVDSTAYVLAFSNARALADFAQGEAEHAAMPGRALAEALAGQDIGVAYDMGCDNSLLLSPDVVSWITDATAEPVTDEARIIEIAPPGGLPEVVVEALARKLGASGALAHEAWLVKATYDGGRSGHLLIFLDPRPMAERPLAGIVSEALSFSGVEAGALDVTFAPSGSAIAERLPRVGLRFDLTPEPEAPGSNPDKPPRLV